MKHLLPLFVLTLLLGNRQTTLAQCVTHGTLPPATSVNTTGIGTVPWCNTNGVLNATPDGN